jgi:PAS domain S-box-containing protein
LSSLNLLMEEGQLMAELLKWLSKAFDDHIDAMVISRVRDGRIERVNAEFLNLFGYSQTEVIGKSSLELSLIEQTDRQTSIDLLKKQEYVRNKNVSIRTKAGEIRNASLTIMEIEDDEDPRMLMIIHDVTEHKQTKQRLALHQELIQHLIDNIPVLLTIWDPNLQKFTLNRHAESVLGWTMADANEGDIMSKVFPDPVYRSEIAAFMQSLSPEWREQNMMAKDGSIIPTTWTNSRLSDETMIGIGLDLRERNKVLQALQESDDNFRLALSHSNFIPARFDREQRYRWIHNPHPDFNPAFMIGKRDDDLDDSQGARRLRSLKQQVIETGNGVREEIAFQRSDGIHWYDFIIEPIRDAGDEIIGGTSAAYDITRQKLAEWSLRESEERLRVTLLSAADEIWIVDTQLRIVSISDSVIENLGVNADKWADVEAALNQLEILHPDGSPRFREDNILPRALRGEIIKNQKEMIRNLATGQLHWREVSGAPVRDSEGTIIGAVAVARDITDRMRAEEALRESESLYRAIAENFPGGAIYIFDRDLRYRVADGEAMKTLGYSREALEGKTIWEATDKETCHLLEQRYPRVLAGESLHFETLLKGRVFSSSYVPIRNEQGHIFAGMVVSHDITEQKLAMESLRQRAEEVERLLEVVPVAVWIANDPQSLTITGNRKANEFYEAQPNENVSATTLPEVRRFFTPDGREIPAEELPMQKAIVTDQNVQDAELHVQLPSGRRIAMLGNAVPLHDQEGNVRGCISAFLDITDRMRAAEELRQLNETLEQRVAERTAEAKQRADALRQLALELSGAEDLERRRIAMILHDDLQQYLAAIRFRLGSLIPDDLSSPKLTEQISAVESLVDESIQKCRNLSHELSPPVLHQNGLIPALKWLSQDMKEKYGLQVNLQAEPGAEPASQMLATVLFRSIRELLFNIVKHANIDSAVMQANSTNGLIRIQVSDPGRGFDLDKIRSQGDSKGGFGLFNVEERINFLGGTFHVKSAPGEGTRIDISVPNRPVRSEKIVELMSDIAEKHMVEYGQTAQEHQGKIRILLADDHAVMREGLTGILQNHSDLEVVAQAKNGLEAMQMADQTAPDVILMDISMPEMDGIAATEKILKKHPWVRIIGLSMHDDPSIEEKMRRAGACDYIYKVSPSDALVQTIRMSVNR